MPRRSDMFLCCSRRLGKSIVDARMGKVIFGGEGLGEEGGLYGKGGGVDVRLSSLH